jgi:hypothetical protein
MSGPVTITLAGAPQGKGRGMTEISTLARLIGAARDEARLAYEFAPNSYAYSGFQAALAAHEEMLRMLADVPQGHCQCG